MGPNSVLVVIPCFHVLLNYFACILGHVGRIKGAVIDVCTNGVLEL